MKEGRQLSEIIGQLKMNAEDVRMLIIAEILYRYRNDCGGVRL